MRIVTLCGMGFGTSLMLKMFLEEILKDLNVQAEIIPWDLGSFKGGGQVDIIVAPKDMESFLTETDASVVLLENLIDKEHITERIKPVLIEKGALSMD
ncbi:MAG: PTS sugar transporter subunit IIB [Anaerolineales bacterium]|nr:PTS sugar transporter subunit IIB [Anaerolineales bacterium]